MARPKVVFFDIGSTLWSSPAEDPGALAYCYGRGRDALLAHHADVPSMETLIEVVEGHFAEWEEIWRTDRSKVLQSPTTDFVREALAKIGFVPAPEALAVFTDALLETSIYTAKTLEPEAGMPEALAHLRGLGLRVACVSNAFMGAAVLNSILDERGLGRYNDLTISSAELGYRKPHPRIYHEALTAMNVSGEESVFVGDRLDADIEGPSALDMRTVLTLQYREYREEDLARARVPPDHIIRHLSELPTYVESLLRE